MNYSVIDKTDNLEVFIWDFHVTVVGSALIGENVDGIARRNQLYVIFDSEQDVKGVHIGSR